MSSKSILMILSIPFQGWCIFSEALQYTLCPRKNYNPRQCKIEMSNLNAF